MTVIDEHKDKTQSARGKGILKKPGLGETFYGGYKPALEKRDYNLTTKGYRELIGEASKEVAKALDIAKQLVIIGRNDGLSDEEILGDILAIPQVHELAYYIPGFQKMVQDIFRV